MVGYNIAVAKVLDYTSNDDNNEEHTVVISTEDQRASGPLLVTCRLAFIAASCNSLRYKIQPLGEIVGSDIGRSRGVDAPETRQHRERGDCQRSRLAKSWALYTLQLAEVAEVAEVVEVAAAVVLDDFSHDDRDKLHTAVIRPRPN